MIERHRELVCRTERIISTVIEKRRCDRAAEVKLMRYARRRTGLRS